MISIAELTTGEPEAQLAIPNVAAPNRIEMIAFSPDGQFLAAGLADGTASVVQVKDSKEIFRLSSRDRLAQIRAWDAAGRPSFETMRIRAYPKDADYVPADGELLIEKPWTRLIVEWTAGS